MTGHVTVGSRDHASSEWGIAKVSASYTQEHRLHNLFPHFEEGWFYMTESAGTLAIATSESKAKNMRQPIQTGQNPLPA